MHRERLEHCLVCPRGIKKNTTNKTVTSMSACFIFRGCIHFIMGSYVSERTHTPPQGGGSRALAPHPPGGGVQMIDRLMIKKNKRCRSSLPPGRGSLNVPKDPLSTVCEGGSSSCEAQKKKEWGRANHLADHLGFVLIASSPGYGGSEKIKSSAWCPSLD